jgi:hypothetical protein
MGGWYNPAGCLTAQLLKIQVWTLMSLLFSCRNHDTLLSIRVCDSKVLIPVSKVIGDAFCEGIEQAAKEDAIRGIWHNLHLEINVNVIEGEVDVAEAAMHFSDGGVGDLHLQYSFYL